MMANVTQKLGAAVAMGVCLYIAWRDRAGFTY
jgi:hypothetical protein